jgi:4-carboxymuconolactone decarboxylase
VTVRAELIEADAGKLRFKAHDEHKKVGGGTHRRAIITIQSRGVCFNRDRQLRNAAWDCRARAHHRRRDGDDRRFWDSTTTIDRLRSAAISTGVTRRSRSQLKFGSSLRRNAAMTDSPLRAKGRAMRRNLMGAAYADKLDQQLYTDPIMEKFAALTQETVFGTLWTRPGLDLKTRTMICVVSDTATGRTPELKLHIRFARNHGWAEDELVEAILHLLGYVGAPLVREALLVAKETFAEMRAENPVTS